MLTDKVLHRFSTGVTWLCLFCILPNDWDSRRRVMTPTCIKWRRRVSATLAHFTAGVCVFVGTAICVDIYLHKTKFEQFIVDGIYFSVSFLVSVIALCCYHLEEQTIVVNAIMRKDNLFKGNRVLQYFGGHSFLMCLFALNFASRTSADTR